MNLTLHVWRQEGPTQSGRFETYRATDISEHISFLEMLDLVNEGLVTEGKEPIAFDHDCREGICGSCGMMVNGEAHGHGDLTTVCQLHMREYRDGQELWVEPWRARAFSVIRDLVVHRTALDHIIQAGGYVSVRTGSAREANAMPIPKRDADAAFDAAVCIGCGACAAACPNASAMLFTAAKVGPSGLTSPGTARAGSASARHGRCPRRGKVRQLHQPRCLSGGVPEGDQRRLHCPPQPGSAQGHDEGAAPPGGGWARGGLAVGHGNVVHA